MSDGKRPDAPESMDRQALAMEVRRLRAENAALRSLTEARMVTGTEAERRAAVLEQAIAMLPVGVLLVDPDDRIAIKNNRMLSFDDDGKRDKPGTPFVELLRFAVEVGLYPEAKDDPEGWIARRMEQHKTPRERVVQRTSDGRFIQIEERRFGEGYTVGSYSDVTDLKRAEEALGEALKQAESDNRAKSIFLANMSHELRTPLNAIIGFTEFLLGESGRTLSEDRRQDLLKDVLFSGRHLATIIADILDLSRAETGQYRINRAPLPVRENLEQIVRLFATKASDRGVDIRIDIDPGLGPDMVADARALHQMLINLLANSLRHTPPGGVVTVAARPAGTGVEISVSDTGSGIAADELDSVLKPFTRGRNTKGMVDGGVGLGLALTRELMDSHGGRMSIASTVGRGTTVTLHFADSTVAPVPA
ncbi:MAG: ATP-binding protein [Pseudomonadota bacterium]|nr:ATP-binding protein [Pseudomonadota bacterium]